MEQVGEFWFRLAVAYIETELLFQRHSGRILRGRENEEWLRLRSDLLALANGTTSADLKLRSAALPPACSESTRSINDDL